MSARYTIDHVDRLMTEKLRRCQTRAILGLLIVTACAYLVVVWPLYELDFIHSLGDVWGHRVHDTGRGGLLLCLFGQGFIATTWLARATWIERRRAAHRRTRT